MILKAVIRRAGIREVDLCRDAIFCVFERMNAFTDKFLVNWVRDAKYFVSTAVDFLEMNIISRFRAGYYNLAA
jgi:hypothetical protein